MGIARGLLYTIESNLLTENNDGNNGLEYNRFIYFDPHNCLLSEYEYVLRLCAIYSNLINYNRWLQVRYIYG